MNVGSNLSARPHRRPSVDHGSLANVRSEIDIGRHQNAVGRHIGAVAHHRVRHHPHPCLGITPLQRHFVMEFKRTDFHRLHGLDWEIQQDGLLDPFVDLPRTVGLGLGHPQRSFVQSAHDFCNSVTDTVLLKQTAVAPGRHNLVSKCDFIHGAKVARHCGVPCLYGQALGT